MDDILYYLPDQEGSSQTIKCIYLIYYKLFGKNLIIIRGFEKIMYLVKIIRKIALINKKDSYFHKNEKKVYIENAHSYNDEKP